ncbi:hypothetical protein ACL02T_32250 [Pseudonocardia sp. RS010]|uniref:hypothetical protein n=1 Tax=Pseudonocardia sp. RS010 TaxID=3385979 RepID=UPI0039A0DB55
MSGDDLFRLIVTPDGGVEIEVGGAFRDEDVAALVVAAEAVREEVPPRPAS